MMNATGEPFAFLKLEHSTGAWNVYYDPSPRLDGNFYYQRLTGFIDGDNAQVIVDLLNENKERFDFV